MRAKSRTPWARRRRHAGWALRRCWSCGAAGAAVEGRRPRVAVTQEQVLEALKQVKDPELGFDIVNLGLVYDVQIDGDHVKVDMTLTTPACMAGPIIVEEARLAIERLEGVRSAEVRLVWEPRWTEDRMSDELKLMRKWGMFR
nr:hypothetical protein [Bacillota bacterium]